MLSAEQAISPFAEHHIGQTPDRSLMQFPPDGRQAHSSAGTWAIRRAIVFGRRALISLRFDTASKETAQLKHLLSIRSGSYFFRYACALRTLEAAILAAQDDFSASRVALMSAASHKCDITATILRYVNWKLGVREEIDAPDTVDYLDSPVGGKAVVRILSLCISSALAFDRLLLAVSANLATEALQLARQRYGSHSPMSAFPAILLAQVAYEQGRFEEAEALLRPRLSVIRASGLPEYIARASVLLARLSSHQGRHTAALAILRETETLGRVRRWPRLVSIALSESARSLETPRYNEGQGAKGDTRRGKAPICRLVAEAAPDALSPDHTLSFSAVEVALRRACSVASHGPIDDGYQLLIPWVRIGAARGLRMVFVDAGRPLLLLLERLYHRYPTNDPRLFDLRPYVATLLRSTVRSDTEKCSAISYRPLSCRETGILQMISHGMSNKRIAQTLGITPETVKSHAKNIFVKLATRTRAQAVARAEAIGFL